MRNTWGFTLIELLIVIVIIGVLSGLLTTNYIAVRQRARDVQRKANISQIQSALELYRADNGYYPVAQPNPNWLLNCPTTDPKTFFGNDADATAPCSITYMQTVPVDPLTKTSYHYEDFASTIYCIQACLENKNDPQIDQTTGATFPNCPALTACPAGTYNYTLINP